MNQLIILIWNANGLLQHKLEVQSILNEKRVDIMLISETHLTNSNSFKIRGYTTYQTNHPDGKAHGGSAILIKNTIEHYQLQEFKEVYLQATSISIKEHNGQCVLSAVYCPPRFSIQKEHFQNYFLSLSNKFIAAGDYNAKHTFWGSRMINTRGKQLFQTIDTNNFDILSSGEPTYWPTDRRKIPDLIDFGVSKGISPDSVKTEAIYDLSSDHSPVLITLNSHLTHTNLKRQITNKHTNWELYTKLTEQSCELSTSLRTVDDIDNAVKDITYIMTTAAENSTPQIIFKPKYIQSSQQVKQLLLEKRYLRRQWQKNRTPTIKTKLNKTIKKLKKVLQEERENEFQNYLINLSPTEATNYSLWKATKKFKRPVQVSHPIRLRDGNWARSNTEKSTIFAEHLKNVFTPNECNNAIKLPALTQHSRTSSIKFKWKTLKKIIKNEMNPKKSPGRDQITSKMIKELPDKCIKFITYIFNACMRTGYFPAQWKISQIIMISKPGKDETQVASYRPISLLPTISKLFEKLILQKMKPILDEKKIIPNHQFGFREQHGTVEQVHRIATEIKAALEEKKYCSAVFLDIAQAFDKVWHEGLFFKIKQYLPKEYHEILCSYLSNRQFEVKYNNSISPLQKIKAGVPQGSVLGPILYLIYTADLPISDTVVTSTFADDTAVLSTHKNPLTASRELQEHLHKIEDWLQRWRIKANETKSSHITFTLRKRSCPKVTLNNTVIPSCQNVKYLGLHLDRRLTWKKHVEMKCSQMKLKFKQMNWLIGRNANLNLDSKVLLYKMIIKPIWTYGIQLWGSTCTSNKDMIQRVQSKILRTLTNAPWYIRNKNIHSDLEVPTVDEAIKIYSKKYLMKLQQHRNELARNLLRKPRYRRLKRTDPLDLANDI